MADGELYPINLDPHVPGTTLPGGVRPNGSIGGSDVGANPRDDQRVRDLIEEYMEQYQILQQLNVLNLEGGGGGDTLIAEYFNSDDVIIEEATPSGTTGKTITGTTRTITLPGGPVRLILAGNVEGDWEPYTPGLPSNGGIGCGLRLIMDGVVIYEVDEELSFAWDTSGQRLHFRVGLNGIAVMEPGKALHSRNGGVTTGAEMTTALAAGDHTFRVDIHGDWSDDDYIRMFLSGEYIAFYAADAAKITSLQEFDSVTPL